MTSISQGTRPAQPKWLKPFAMVGSLIPMLVAMIMNINTHAHLAGRIPDWAGMTYLLPIGLWAYNALCTVIWAATEPGTSARKRAGIGVGIAAGMMEVMSIGEHIWGYWDRYETIDWGISPLLIFGSLPTALDVLSVHLLASVIAGHHVPERNEDAVPEHRRSAVPERAEPEADAVPEQEESVVPEPVFRPEPIVPVRVPDPVPPATVPEPSPEPVVPEPAPKPEPPKPERNEDSLAPARAARQKVVDDIAETVMERLAEGVDPDDLKKELTPARLTETFPEVSYGERNWRKVRDDGIELAVKLHNSSEVAV